MEQTFSAERLRRFTRSVFEHCGMSGGDAETCAEVLISADLRGIDSHGVARLSGYVRLHEAGRANFKGLPVILHETPSTATLDANENLGLVSGREAMKLAIKKAHSAGTGWVAVTNSNHFGISAAHALLAARENMIGIAMTNASPLVAPTGSKERMLGTNPVCFVFPARKFKPVVVDMATSSAANGKLEIASRGNKPIPKGWALDQEGNDTTSPEALKTGGLLLPLGSGETMAGHKGYGLAAAVDIFSGVLSGANYGPWVPPFVDFLKPLPDLPGKGIGHFFGALRVDAFRPSDEYFTHMDQWIERFRSAKPIDENVGVLVPGEPEAMVEMERMDKGIPLNEHVAADLMKMSERFGIRL